MFCTPIFILGQDESQGTTNKIVDDQSQTAFWLDKSQSRILRKIQILYFVSE